MKRIIFSSAGLIPLSLGTVLMAAVAAGCSPKSTTSVPVQAPPTSQGNTITAPPPGVAGNAAAQKQAQDEATERFKKWQESQKK
ncbi:MAG: hypothetical protein H7Z41_01770 [Cytophagales bacterium]|nr:hypothetical protein [Armatimonadota bacterium]